MVSALMSDIRRTRSSKAPRAGRGRDGAPARRGRARPSADTAAERVLVWIEKWMHRRGSAAGDALPTELQIARETGTGRSSVREALTALKVLGLIRSRRKDGIRLLRDPVLLELRHYFGEAFDTPDRYAEALEFRAILEWGLGPLIFARTTADTIRRLRKIIANVAQAGPSCQAIQDGEIRFHTALASGCGNRLAALLARLYGPVFRHDAAWNNYQATPVNLQKWVRGHEVMVDALEARNERRFVRLLRQHTHGYMRR